MKKIVLLLSSASLLILASCTTKYTGQLINKGQAIKVIQDDGGAKVVRTSLNGENFEVKLKERESFQKWVYEKVPTKYGELEIVRDGTIGLFDNRIWWDYFLDGNYTGTININMGGLSTGPGPRVQN